MWPAVTQPVGNWAQNSLKLVSVLVVGEGARTSSEHCRGTRVRRDEKDVANKSQE